MKIGIDLSMLVYAGSGVATYTYNFHSSDYLRPPLLKGTKGITTIHDLTWKLFPQYHTKEVISHHERKLKRTIALGDIIIVDSENTRRDLINAYSDIKKKNIHLLHLGVDERFKRVKNPSVITRTLSKYLNQSNRGSAPYLLYVGAIEPRKNLDTAIRVYADLIKEVQKYQNIPAPGRQADPYDNRRVRRDSHNPGKDLQKCQSCQKFNLT